MSIVTIHYLKEEHFPNSRFGHSQHIDSSHYKVVVTYGSTKSGEAAAEEAFDLSNNPMLEDSRTKHFGNQRSLSVGDIVEVAENHRTRKYYCQPFGWKELVDELA